MREDSLHMQRCFALSARALGICRPNPAVGCVLVKDAKVLSEGWTQAPGQAHAEVHALQQAGAAANRATAYVSLEPCAHHGRTGPCVTALIQAGIARVVYGMQDPNPLVCGQGLAMLREAGVQVDGPVLESEAQQINPGFSKRMRTGLPYVRCKVAMSLDGRTAMASGESQWITGAQARADVQQWRARSCAIVTGIGTVLHDDPALTVRLAEFAGQQPMRVVVDSLGKMPPSARLLSEPGEVLLAGAGACPPALRERTHLHYRRAANADGKVDLVRLLQILATEFSCNEVLVEAGGILTGALLQAGLVDELLTYVAPVMLGHQARPMAQLDGLHQLNQGVSLQFVDVAMLGKDCRIRSQVVHQPGTA